MTTASPEEETGHSSESPPGDDESVGTAERTRAATEVGASRDDDTRDGRQADVRRSPMDAWGEDSSEGERMLTPDSPDTSEPRDVPQPYDPSEPICPPAGPRLPP
eukprot:5862035-Pleurochrysis_carterae.AAC.1